MYKKLLNWLFTAKKKSLKQARLDINPLFRSHTGSGYAFPAAVEVGVELPFEITTAPTWMLCKLSYSNADPKPTSPALVIGKARNSKDAKLHLLGELGDGSFASIMHYNLQPTVQLRVSLSETATSDEIKLEFIKLNSLTARLILAARIFDELVLQREGRTKEVVEDLSVFAKMSIAQGLKVTGQAKDIVLGVTPLNLVEPPPSPLSEYEKWFFKQNGSSTVVKSRARDISNAFPIRPKFSIIIPAYKSNELFLREAVDSVRRQIYTNWELLIVNDGSNDPGLSELLADLASSEYRIRAIELSENVGISQATNKGIEQASGDFIAFLDHDDILCDDALFWFADSVNRNHSAKIIYSDHDVYSQSGHLRDHNFKPDWNPLLLLSENYINHLVAVTRELALNNPLRQEYDGSQDHDFLLRVTSEVKDDQIVHIPRILYHWRAVEGSVALNTDEKSYAVPAARRALQSYLDEHFPGAKVEAEGIHNRVKFPVPDPAPSVAIVIPTKDGLELLQESIGTLVKFTNYPNYKIKVIDNQSTDPDTLKYLGELEETGQIELFHYDKPFNYSDMHNVVIEQLSEDLVLLLNNDTSIIEGEWLNEMVSLISVYNTAVVGAKLLYPDGTIQHGGVLVGNGGGAGVYGLYQDQNHSGYYGRLKLTQNLTAVTGACLLIRRDVYLEVGGMDIHRFRVAFNDVDLCLRVIEAGYKVAWTPYATLVHHESKSRGFDGDDKRKINRLMGEISYLRERWETQVMDDPNYNPNLEIMSIDLFKVDENPRVPTLSDFIQSCYKADGKRWEDIEDMDQDQKEQALRQKYHLRLLHSPYEFRRKNLED